MAGSTKMTEPNIPPLRHFTESEFATIGKVMLLWGMHEQNIGTIVSVFHKVPNAANSDLVHSVGYSRKIDLASTALKTSGAPDLAAELQHIKRVFRPERDTLAHGAFGTWDQEAWVRAIAKPRFVLADDLGLLHARADYAWAVSLEAVMRIHGQASPRDRPPRPPEPHSQVPQAWAKTPPPSSSPQA
jgi:hypothetical protein